MNSITFLKDVLKQLPSEVSIRFVSNEERFPENMKPFDFSTEDGNTFTITGLISRALVLGLSEENDFLDFTERVEMKEGNKLLFEGYDGMEFGTISKTISLDGEFRKKYVEGDMCSVSDNW